MTALCGLASLIIIGVAVLWCIARLTAYSIDGR